MSKIDKFIPIFNVMFDNREESNKYKVNAEELLTYYVLYQYKSYLREESKVFFVGVLEDLKKKDTKENREHLKQTIKNLKESKAIRIHKTTKDYCIISFNFIDKFKEVASNKTKYVKGFEKIYVEELDILFEKTKYNAHMVYLYSMFKSKEFGGWVNLSYGFIAKNMQTSESTVRRAIAKLKELKLIHVNTVKVKKDRHEANGYRVVNIMGEVWAKREEELEKEQEEEGRRELERLERQSLEDFKKESYEGGDDYYTPFLSEEERRLDMETQEEMKQYIREFYNDVF